jgi:hypothetical protein
MKMGNKAHLTAFLLFFAFCIQTAEVKFPSLAELAQKASEPSITIDSSEFEKLTLEAKQQILAKKGTLEQVLNFVNQHHDDIKQELIAAIPNKLWDAMLLSENTTIQDFAKQINDFSKSEHRWLTAALAQEILAFLDPDPITIIAFQSIEKPLPESLTAIQLITRSRIYQLPIDFVYFGAFPRIQIMYDPEMLLISFLYQKLQHFIIDNLKVDIPRNRIILDEAIKEKAKSIFNSINLFAKKYAAFITYASFLNKTIQNLFDEKYTKAIAINLPKEIWYKKW